MFDHTPTPILVLLGFTTLGFAFFAYKSWQAWKVAQENDLNERFESAHREMYRIEEDILRGLDECERRMTRNIDRLDDAVRSDLDEIGRDLAALNEVPRLSPKEIAMVRRTK